MIKRTTTTKRRWQQWRRGPRISPSSCGNSGDADSGSDPPVCLEDGGNSDGTGHGHFIVLTSTGKTSSFFRSLPSLSPCSPLLPPPCAHSSCRTRRRQAKTTSAHSQRYRIIYLCQIVLAVLLGLRGSQVQLNNARVSWGLIRGE